MRFFLTNLGEQKVILGYPWFAAMQPKIDWARGWIDYDQLPVVLRSNNATLAIRGSRKDNKPRPLRRKITARRVETTPIKEAGKRQTIASKLAEQNQPKTRAELPSQYRRHAHVFSETEAQRFPKPRVWDHVIELKTGA